MLDSTFRPFLLQPNLQLALKFVPQVNSSPAFFANLVSFLAASSPQQAELLRRDVIAMNQMVPSPVPLTPPGLGGSVEVVSGPKANQQTAGSRIESLEPISKFLAMLRKNGMDLLFPLTSQDKVLATIYVACSNPDSEPLAHRELIDVVMHAKESSPDLSDCESCSKTKVRGILALLKHADILVAQAVGEGCPVQLLLAHSIQTFDDVRKKLDDFLVCFSTNFDLKVPEVLWAELTWRGNRPKRLAAVISLSSRLRTVIDSRSAHDVFSSSSSLSSSSSSQQAKSCAEFFLPLNDASRDSMSPMTTTDTMDARSDYSSTTPVMSRTTSLDYSTEQSFAAFDHSLWVSTACSAGNIFQPSLQSSSIEDEIERAYDLFAINQTIRYLAPGVGRSDSLVNEKWQTDQHPAEHLLISTLLDD